MAILNANRMFSWEGNYWNCPVNIDSFLSMKTLWAKLKRQQVDSGRSKEGVDTHKHEWTRKQHKPWALLQNQYIYLPLPGFQPLGTQPCNVKGVVHSHGSILLGSPLISCSEKNLQASLLWLAQLRLDRHPPTSNHSPYRSRASRGSSLQYCSLLPLYCVLPPITICPQPMLFFAQLKTSKHAPLIHENFFYRP